MAPTRHRLWVYLLAVLSVFLVYQLWVFEAKTGRSYFWSSPAEVPVPPPSHGMEAPNLESAGSRWRSVPTRHPVTSMRPLPTGKPLVLPKIQTTFSKESASVSKLRQDRKKAVKDAFLRCWNSYKSLAWTADELTPVSGKGQNLFGGWGATLVDSLDTLWIMGLHDEFHLAVAAAANISFESTTLDEVNVFETTIRYLGGFLSAYDLSGDERLLHKAKELGEMLYVAFDTPNRMPITRWKFEAAANGMKQVAPPLVLVAEIGSLTMEFTRLSILTGDPKWYDAVQTVMEVFEQQQMTTHLPGMWPLVVNAQDTKFNEDSRFTLGAMSDSTYEYLPKMYALVNGLLPMYQDMYEKAMDAAIANNFFRPMVPDEKDILISGFVETKMEDGKKWTELQASGQHLVCFAGGMLALGSKLFNIEDHLSKAEKLVDGCIWTYQAMPLGIMPESFYMLPCKSLDSCPWDETAWKQEVLRAAGEETADLSRADDLITAKRLPKGFTMFTDPRYVLRPEAIESVFVLYRTTGRTDLLETAWTMFNAIQENTRTALANSALEDVTVTDGSPQKSDSMESFWLGETLKYFYLIFSDPDLISLDEWVFNTEAHPFKRLLA